MYRLKMYSPVRAWRKEDMPTNPTVYIELGTYTMHNSHILLSSELASDIEVDEAVAQLKCDLDEFSKIAKRELKAMHRKMLEK